MINRGWHSCFPCRRVKTVCYIVLQYFYRLSFNRGEKNLVLLTRANNIFIATQSFFLNGFPKVLRAKISNFQSVVFQNASKIISQKFWRSYRGWVSHVTSNYSCTCIINTIMQMKKNYALLVDWKWVHS